MSARGATIISREELVQRRLAADRERALPDLPPYWRETIADLLRRPGVGWEDARDMRSWLALGVLSPGQWHRALGIIARVADAEVGR